MLSEHNPIAELIHQIQKKWTTEASPHDQLKLTRWLIKPEEARLFEAFLKLESSEHGSIPEVLVAMLTPFANKEDYSKNLVGDWVTAFKKDEKIKDKGFNWDTQPFELRYADEGGDHQKNLLDMLLSFRQLLPEKDTRLVVALLPHSIADMGGYKLWLTDLLTSNIPEGISFMIFDQISKYSFDSVFRKFPEITKTLHVDLDLDGAVGKIAKMGDPNSPEVILRQCILEMGKCVQAKDRGGLDKWGQKALNATQKSNSKSMFASAHIVYAGMLFNFKQFKKIDELLNEGLTVARQGLKTETAACTPLVIQYYGFIGASKQLQKKYKEAIRAYEIQGDLAAENNLGAMSLTSYRMAYSLSKKHLAERYDENLKKAFLVGKSLSKEEQSNSSLPAIALDYLHWLEVTRKQDEYEEIDLELNKILGSGWKERAKKPASFAPETHQSVLLT